MPIIKLIPKPQKDPLLLHNWQSISLLNNDYKLIALVVAKSLKYVVNSMIDESQSGFYKIGTFTII